MGIAPLCEPDYIYFSPSLVPQVLQTLLCHLFSSHKVVLFHLHVIYMFFQMVYI